MNRRPAADDGPWDVVVVGAGAAGLMAALFAGRAGASVLLLETRPRPGAKIRVSGGGRCNVLPSAAAPADFHTSGSTASLRKILSSWSLAQVREFFAGDLGVPLKREADGKLFPRDDDPRRVVRGLLDACRAAGVSLWGERRVARVALRELPPRAGRGGGRDAPERGFALMAAGGATVACRRLVLATGGLSLPQTGSDGHGYALARSLGHSLMTPYPALVPLLSTDRRWAELAGVSLTATVSAARGGKVVARRQGSFLFTHRGFSGPVVLDMSRHATGPEGEATRLLARWGGAVAPAWDPLLRRGGARPLVALLSEHLPRRLAGRLVAAAGLDARARPADLDRARRLALVALLEACELPIAGSEGYGKAEVTGGGIPLAEIEPRTLASRVAPGLHLAGEMLDVTGRIGGFNFLWAWVTGRLAGEAAAHGAAPRLGG